METCYLFVHFREKMTPDGEQVYFALSRDAFHWEAVNGGRPVMWAYYGDKGVRDMTVVRSCFDSKFHIFATDLSLSYGMRGKYCRSWDEIKRRGSKCLAHFVSENLVDWTEEVLEPIGDESFGCLWAPDILFDEEEKEYILHFSASRQESDFKDMAIYACRTRDFAHFTAPELFYRKDDSSVIDSAAYYYDGKYYLFVKSEKNPATMILLSATSTRGPWTRIPAFDTSMSDIAQGLYEAPTAVRLDDGRWCLFVDYYGVRGAGQGYVPFVSDGIESGVFARSDSAFSFPYGFKHGTILKITPEEYERVRDHVWKDD